MGDDLDARRYEALRGADADALIDVGCDLADADRQEQALVCFRRAVDLGQDWAWFNVANTLRELGRPLEAVAAYERALAAGETDAWLNLGHVLHGLGDLAGAERAFGAAAERAGQPEGHLELAVLLHEQGEVDRADEVISRAADAGFLPAVATRASWRWERTRDPALEAELRAGAPVDGGARADLAALLLATGRPREARAELELGAKLGQRECWLPLGNLLAGDELTDDADDADVDTAAAEDAYRAGIAAGDAYCHHNLGLLLLAQGDTRGAEEQFLAGAVAGDDLAQRAWHDLHG
jgi:tetratricopeptide (TPR) repeat protein